MPDILQVTVDKFTFRVPTDRVFSPEGVWVMWLPGTAEGRVRIGVTDYLQQHSGDVAFADMMPAGTELKAGDEAGTIETIKATLQLVSPIAGVVVATNPALGTAPEIINQDPYGEGWLAEIMVTDGAAQQSRLLDPDAYFAHMKEQAEAEVDAL
jgi:glycine cleavage system H protein